MKLLDIKERHSVRNFSDKAVPDEIIENILEAGRLAPSWVNVQPWHFIAIRDKETKELLKELSSGQPHLVTADTVIICCGNKMAWEYNNYKAVITSKPGIPQEKIDRLLSYPNFNQEGQEAVKLRCVEEVTYAVAYMTLEAHKNGLGCCIIGAFGNELTETNPEVYEKVRERLNLPEEILLIKGEKNGFKNRAACFSTGKLFLQD